MRSIILLMILVVLTVESVNAKRNPDSAIFQPRHIKKAMNKAAEWQLQHPKHALYDWTNGAFYAGLYAGWETTGSKTMYKAMIQMGEENEWKPGPRLQHADDHVICQTYLDLFRNTGDRRMIQPFIETMEKFRDTPYTAKDIEKITWWWCDALFMAPPALVKLGNILEDPSWFALNDRLFEECHALLYDREEQLYARDIRYKWNEPGIETIKEANGNKIFWSRGNGWVLAGLARVLAELPSDYHKRSFYLQNFREMAARVAGLQQPDGLWRASLLDPESYPGGEASGSGFYCYALAWGINEGILDRDTYLPVVKKAWTGLNSLIQPDGRVGWVQPIGADPRKNFAADSWEVYGTGAFLLAGSEVIKLPRK